MKISDKIAYLRKQKGWSQEQLAIKLDVSRQAVYKWEANMTYPEIDKLKKLATLFDISFNDFFDDSIDITKKVEKSPAVKVDEQKKEEDNEKNSQSSVNIAEGVAVNPPKKPKTTQDGTERSRKIALITAFIVGIIACITIAIVAFLLVTSKNTEGPSTNPPVNSGDNGSGSGSEGGSSGGSSGGEIEYCKVTCKVLGKFYSMESVVKGSTYEPEFLGVEGYTFEGWLHGSELWDVDNSKVTRDIILTAILTPNINTVIFHANDGTNNKWERELETGTGVLISGPDYVRDGYSFKGYSYSSDGEDLMAVGEHFTVKAGTNTLYAIWEKKGDETPSVSYNIKYNLAGGENNPLNPTTYSGTEPVLLREPTKEFYSFNGWYSDSLYKNKVTKIENITKDTVFFAKWDYVGYTITLNASANSCISLERISLHLGISEIQGSPFDLCSKLTIYCDAESKPSGWNDKWNVYNCPVKWGQQGEAGLYDGLTFIEQSDGTISVGTSKDLENVIIPEAVNGKRVTEILADSFKNNTILKTVTIYARDITVGLYAFEGCTALEGVYVTDLDAWLSIDFQDKTANPLSNGADLYVGSFREYEKLTSLVVPSNTDTVKRYAFYGCTSLERVEFHENISSLGEDCFKDCTNLKYVTVANLEKWCDVKIASIDANPMVHSESVYLKDDKITSLNLDVENVGDYCFAGCKEITEVTLSAENTVRIGTGAFSGCIALESIGIPKIVTYVGKGAFENCTALSIYYESLDKPSGWDLNWNISNCPVYYGCLDNKTEYYEFSNGQITKYVGSSSSIVIPSEIDGNKVTCIVEGAFTNNKNIVSVVLPSSIVSIDERAFSGCDKLETVIIPEGVKIIGNYAFEDCKSLKSVVVPSTAVMIYGYTFRGCTSLKEATISEGLISVCSNMFEGCTQLETVNLPTTMQTLGQYAFADCSSLKNITLPDGLTTINRSVFLRCTSLTEIFIPISVTTIGSFVFNDTSDSLVIKCEAESQPDGWASFLFSNKTVLWGQKR